MPTASSLYGKQEADINQTGEWGQELWCNILPCVDFDNTAAGYVTGEIYSPLPSGHSASPAST